MTIRPEMLEFDTDNREPITAARDLIDHYFKTLSREEYLELRRSVVPIQRAMGQTYEQIGMIWGVTRERIRQECLKFEQQERARKHRKALLESLGIDLGEEE